MIPTSTTYSWRPICKFLIGKPPALAFPKLPRKCKVRTDYLGPNSYDPKAERDALDQAVQQKATGILWASPIRHCSKTALIKPSRLASP